MLVGWLGLPGISYYDKVMNIEYGLWRVGIKESADLVLANEHGLGMHSNTGRQR